MALKYAAITIKYTGHSCFKIYDEITKYSIIIDPYKPGSVPGFHDIKDLASLVLTSHDHDDHNGTECVQIEPKDESPFRIDTIDTFHDPVGGAQRGKNRIHVITYKETGEKIVHYGDIGEDIDELLTEENLALLKDAIVAMVPIGGVYTYDMEQAIELVERTTPMVAVPMHFRSKIAGFGLPNIASIEDFIGFSSKKGKCVSVSKLSFLSTIEMGYGCPFMVLKPFNM